MNEFVNKYEIILDITQKAQEHFVSDLDSVLLYGSSLSPGINSRDIDLIIILKKREKLSDLIFFKELIVTYKENIDLQILNISDIKSKHFSHDSHGEFFIQFLKNTKTIFGKNPFLDISVDYSRQVSSIIQKIQYYYFRAMKMLMKSSFVVDAELCSYHRKKILFLLIDFYCAYSGEIIDINDKEKILNVVNSMGVALEHQYLDFLFRTDNLYTFEHIFNIYQLFYFRSLDILQPQTENHIYNINGLFSKKVLCKKNNDQIAIIASGCPTDYNENEITLFLNIRGYDVATFHYSATGLSTKDTFVSPVVDLSNIINFYSQSYKKIILIGNSYGGFASLCVANNYKNLDKIIAISPVINFKNLKDYNTLPFYLSKEKALEYRYSPKEFLRFMEKITMNIPQNPANIHILHGSHDDQISIEEIITFCKQLNIDLKNLSTGHLSLNRLTREYLKDFALYFDVSL